ncbi:hypothetical protein GMRT_11716 [Giardia muris]|uniref:Uncharacterized protein n=1 Tax=Giardia muris TaxID=5742 RepID=A0A4Z1SPD3_GIAMU|nr:hypothetical protein GMRT_11716 [Giardia muris]|eukprot:TNJ26725.1 hypothetical protein GMRT_11716 [Giardia muris]
MRTFSFSSQVTLKRGQIKYKGPLTVDLDSRRLEIVGRKGVILTGLMYERGYESSSVLYISAMFGGVRETFELDYSSVTARGNARDKSSMAVLLGLLRQSAATNKASPTVPIASPVPRGVNEASPGVPKYRMKPLPKVDLSSHVIFVNSSTSSLVASTDSLVNSYCSLRTFEMPGRSDLTTRYEAQVTSKLPTLSSDSSIPLDTLLPDDAIQEYTDAVESYRTKRIQTVHVAFSLNTQKAQKGLDAQEGQPPIPQLVGESVPTSVSNQDQDQDQDQVQNKQDFQVEEPEAQEKPKQGPPTETLDFDMPEGYFPSVYLPKR